MAPTPSKYIPSKQLYAFRVDQSAFTSPHPPFTAHDGRRLHSYDLEALWTKTRKGVVQVSHGRIRVVGVPQCFTLAEVLAQAPSIHGGTPDYQWDGQYMWAPNATLREMNDAADMLNPILLGLPGLPADWDGWYSLA